MDLAPPGRDPSRSRTNSREKKTYNNRTNCSHAQKRRKKGLTNRGGWAYDGIRGRVAREKAVKEKRKKSPGGLPEK